MHNRPDKDGKAYKICDDGAIEFKSFVENEYHETHYALFLYKGDDGCYKIRVEF